MLGVGPGSRPVRFLNSGAEMDKSDLAQLPAEGVGCK